mgnify:CR=1 FL=1
MKEEILAQIKALEGLMKINLSNDTVVDKCLEKIAKLEEQLNAIKQQEALDQLASAGC